jgi:hypothetical protein
MWLSSHFQIKQTLHKGLGFLMRRFSGRALNGGLLIVPEIGMEAPVAEGIPFSVKGKATDAQ